VSATRDAVRAALYGAQSPDVAVRASVLGAPASGDLDAELQRIARETGVPLGTARALPEETRRAYQTDQIIRALSGHPLSTRFMADPDRAAIARDDVESLTQIEDLVTGEMRDATQAFLPSLLTALQRGGWRARQGLTHLMHDLGLFRGLDAAQDEAARAAGMLPQAETATAAYMAEQQRQAQRYAPPPEVAAGMRAISDAPTLSAALSAALDAPDAVLTAVVESMGAAAPALAVGALAAPFGPLAMAGATTAGVFATEYGATLQDVLAEAGVNLRDLRELQAAMADPALMDRAREKALLRGVPVSVAAGLSAGLAGRLLARAQPSVASVAARAAGEAGLQVGAGATGEGAAQALTGEYRPGDIVMEALGELPTALVEVPANWQAARAHAELAVQRRAQVERLSKISAAAKVRARDTATFEAFIADVVEQSPEVDSLYIDAQAFLQSGLAEQAVALSPSIAEQLPVAVASGGQVRVPLSEYAARLAGTELDQVLLQHARTAPDGMSAREAEEFMQGAQAELEREASLAIREDAAASAFRESVQAIHTKVRDMLVSAGERPQAADAYAALTSHFYAAMAVRLGKTPEEVFETYPQHIVGDLLGDGQEFTHGAGARGSFNPRTNTIRLLKARDRSTYLHESGHFFLENLLNIAEQIETRGGETTHGEQSILRDARALLRWFGVQDLATWNALDFEEKRSYHERFAESFESYLFSGRAPSLELQSTFQTFRAWLVRVYQSLKKFLAAHPQAGKLNDDVRGVMDRLLATDEQIDLARRARSMHPVFASPQEGQMTAEEFAALQDLGAQASVEAQEELQSRSLRDTRWLVRARARAVRRLTREAKETRNEVQAEARTAVMSQPVYRAWVFLSGRLSERDKRAMAGTKRPKSKPGSVDPTIDSLFVAIAKLGGLDRAEVEAEWGLDPATRLRQPVFGKPVLRRTGGRSIDGMTEVLLELGYLEQDAYGREARRSFENSFDAELRGDLVYSRVVDAAVMLPETEPGEAVMPQMLDSARLSIPAMERMGIEWPVIELLKARRLAAQDGVHPDLVAGMFEMETGDELVSLLSQALPPREAVEAETDARMIEEHADLSSPEAIEMAADQAVHNEARARFVAAEAAALQKMAEGGRVTTATGRRGPAIAPAAAKLFAAALIARQKVRNLKPAQYAATAARAGAFADRAFRKGDTRQAAAEKRTQALQTYAAREAHQALAEVRRGVAYLKKFSRASTRKRLPRDYLEQIDALLARYELSTRSLKTLDRRASLREWLDSQREDFVEPDIDPEIENEARRVNYRELTVEEFRGLVDAVEQIEHLARLKQRLLTARDKVTFEELENRLVRSIEDNATKEVTPRTAATKWGQLVQGIRRFAALHFKAAAIARIFDGGQDGGPFWSTFIRSANERGDQQIRMRAEASARVMEILAPVLATGGLTGQRKQIAGIGRHLNRMERMVIALNAGNDTNLQRLFEGEGWPRDVVQRVLESLTATELRAVQQVWDFFDSYRPMIAAKELRVLGKEPKWVVPTPLEVRSSDGEVVSLRGGYYPIKYDPAASARAEAHQDAEGIRLMMRGAHTAATTRRGYTKDRAAKGLGGPLLLTMDGLFEHLEEVIHDVTWHEWLIDTNRLLRSNKIQKAIRTHHGPEAAAQLKQWVQDIAIGEQNANNEGAASWLRRNVALAGLGFNVMTGAMQVTGLANSLTRVGPRWLGPAIMRFASAPAAEVRDVMARSEFMKARPRTLFVELAELRAVVMGNSRALRNVQAIAFLHIAYLQLMVDIPTWQAAYARALAAGADEAGAAAIADQTVIDTQGSGMLKDLSAIERGGPALRLFTVFYGYMNAVFNLSATTLMTRKSRLQKAVSMLLLFSVPVVWGHFMRATLTPAVTEEDDEEYWKNLPKTLAAEHVSYMLGTVVFARELSNVGAALLGTEGGQRGFEGTAGERIFGDVLQLAQQAHQGEFDRAFRKELVNVVGLTIGLPAGQINRTLNGIEALVEDETDNPAALLFGVQR